MFFEVSEVGLAKATADGGKVEFDVVGVFGGECLQEVVAQFGAGGARQASSLPDFADRVAALIPTANDGSDFLLQRFVGADLLFEFRHACRRQQFVKPGGDFAIGPGHGGWQPGNCESWDWVELD